jgi:hypothetical protein
MQYFNTICGKKKGIIMKTIKSIILGSTIIASGLIFNNVSAATVSFQCITPSLPNECTIGETQLSVDVIDLDAAHVQFQFYNNGLDASSIEGVYFDDGALLSISSVLNSTGVSFTAGSANPGNLPDGNLIDPPFETTAGFLADSNPPTSHNGVNPGEVLGIEFELQPGLGYANVLDDLNNGNLRIGLHVIAFDSGASASFVNVPVPLPPAVLLFGSALVTMFGYNGWRKKT